MSLAVSTETCICFLTNDLIDLVSYIFQIKHIVTALTEDDHHVYYCGVALVAEGHTCKLSICQILFHYINRYGFHQIFIALCY